MKLKISIDHKTKDITLKGKKQNVQNLITELKIIEEDYIITRNDEVLFSDDELKNNDKIKLHKVWSGG